MPRFIAIPVGQGDAFYVEREGFSMLIDGGRSRTAFPSMFQEVTKRDGVNVVVCTHNDADHANGILGLLEAGLKCGEVWLPGRWLSALPDLLRPFVEVFVELADNVAETGSWSNMENLQSSVAPIEAYAERMYPPVAEAPGTEDGLSVAENGWPESYLQMLERAEPWGLLPHWPESWDPVGWRCLWWHGYYRWLGPAGIRLLWSAIEAAGQIRAIATAAFHRGIPVRWFEFDTATPSGGVPALQAINAHPVARVRPRVGSLLAWLALTVSNKESLVFWSPPIERHPGVLFTADSDLKDIRLPTHLNRAIATAPHHGSKANANAYKAVETTAQDGFPSITWVRSDGRDRSRPGGTYLGLAARRLCTRCRHAGGGWTTEQAVYLYSCKGAWTRHRTSQVCSCQ